MTRVPTSLVLIVLAAGCADRTPPPAREGGITIMAAFATASAVSDMSAVYFTIRNPGSHPDTLLSIHAHEGLAELHTVVTQAGRSSMRRVDQLSIAPGSEVRLEPGGYHVMLSGLPTPLEAGDTVELTAVFARADTLAFRAPVMTYTEVVERLESVQERQR